MRQELGLSPFKIILIYLIIGGLWIYLFDGALFTNVRDPVLLAKIHALEDSAYLVLTAGMLYLLINRHLKAVRRWEKALQESEAKYRNLFSIARENEQRFKSLFEHNSDMVYSVDLDGYFLSANPTCERLSGQPVANWLGRHFNEFVVEEDRERCMAHFLKAVQGQPQSYEIGMLHRDGHKVLVHVKNVPIYVDDQLIGVYGITRDITESKRAEEELRQTRDQLESFINHTADAIYVCDLQGDVRKVNQAFEKMYGWRAEEVIGKRIPVIPDDKWEEVQQLRADLQKYGHAYALDTIRRRKDGTELNVSVTISPIRNGYGKLVGMAGIARDMTESKRVEAALRESEARYRLIAENTSDLIGVLNMDGRVQYASPGHETVLGYGVEGYEDRPVFDFIHPDDVPSVQAVFAEMIRTKRPREVVSRNRKVDGSWVFLELRGMPVFDDQGDVQSVVVVARDITERRKTEAILRKSDKLSVVGQLAAGVAHEIRNPLTAIKGFVQLLNEQSREASTYYDIILSELNRIEFIIGEFLVLSKPQSVKFQLRDIRLLLQNIIALLETQAILNNVQIVTDFAADIPDIECEEHQLKQVFVNVLKNSIESMPKGGMIAIGVQMEEEQVLISIADQGCGIPPERLHMLGEPFYTTKEKGTGLGLMVSYRIIEDHQGSLTFKSEVDQGTLVEVRLPVQEYAEAL